MLYVNDILITGTNYDKIQETIRILCSEFKMKLPNEPKLFLEIDIKRNIIEEMLILSQKIY